MFSRRRCDWRRCWSCRQLYPVLDGLVAALKEKGKEFHPSLSRVARTCRTQCPCGWGRSSRRTPAAIKRAKKSMREQSELLREVGLGGSAVGTGINTHPDYRHKAVAELVAHLRREAARGRRHALRDAIQPRDVERQFRDAQSGTGGDSHLQRPAAAVIRTEHRAGGD